MKTKKKNEPNQSITIRSSKWIFDRVPLPFSWYKQSTNTSENPICFHTDIKQWDVDLIWKGLSTNEKLKMEIKTHLRKKREQSDDLDHTIFFALQFTLRWNNVGKNQLVSCFFFSFAPLSSFNFLFNFSTKTFFFLSTWRSSHLKKKVGNWCSAR